MGADLSRVRLNSLLDFAAVEIKQGGVLLDADANESAAIIDRRLRALASDVLGRATVSATTPDAFKLSLVGGQLLIGRGRLYVDGLLAENHGVPSDTASKRAFDDLMAELVFTDDVPYDAQPYYPQPEPLPEAGKHLIYLDVWNREVTQLENPDLVESAVGVETSSRVQTVWQVRALADDAANNTCASPDADFDGWSDLTAPSTGVLTTGTFDVAASDDPCELPPTGGYRGLENQLYRVEIHDAGQPGAGATFKWSRENASVGSTTASIISATELELPSLGRDDVLRFNTGDWVEITDDVREFSQAPGEIRRITVTEATRRVTFTPALPATMLPTTFPDTQFGASSHLRLRRWDQKGKVFRKGSGGSAVQIQDLDASGSSGLVAVPAAGVEVLLENGVTVSFDTTGAKGFRSGDYWVFAARTTDTSVETLNRAPPRGIHHHYVRLGIWDIDAGTVSDCRNPWPPSRESGDCGCSACVSPDSHASGELTIQDAVNKVAETGGTVCLKPGVYALQEAVRVANARSVRIRGQGPNTVLVAPTGAFFIENGMAIAIENLSVLTIGGNLAIGVQGALGLTLRELVVALVGKSDQQAGAAIGLAGVVAGVTIRDNAIVAPIGIMAIPALGTRINALVTDTQVNFLLTAKVIIDDNLFWCERRAVALVGSVLHLMSTRMAGNEVVGCRDAAVSMLGVGAPGSSLAIRGNSFNVIGDGIQCGVDGASIESNKLTNTAPATAARVPITVGVALLAGLDKNGSDQCQILANQISGFQQAGIRIGTPTRELIIKLNIIEGCGNGIVSTDDADGGSMTIENNQLSDIGTDAAGDVLGIGLRRAVSATIAGNVIRSLGTNAQSSQLRAGILTFAVTRSRIYGNEISELAPATDFLGTTAGIMIRAPFLQFEVSNNHVQRDATTSTVVSRSAWQALVVMDVAQTGVSKVGTFTAVTLSDTQMLVLGRGIPFISAISNLQDTGDVANGPVIAPGAVVLDLSSGSVVGNTLLARGGSAAVEILARGECLFNDNRVEARLNAAIDAVTVTARSAIVSANRVRGGEPSIRVTSRVAAVLGNITSGTIVVPNGLQDPWLSLNLRG